MGSVFKVPGSKNWWIQYYRHGKRFRESSESEKKGDAQRLLKRREGRIAEGKTPGIVYDKIIWDELAEGYLRDYRLNKRKSIPKAERCIKHLKKHFEGMRVTNIDTDKIGKFIEARLSEGAKNATVNRELAAMKRLLNLGKRAGKVNTVPYIPMLAEHNVREGFIGDGEFLALRDALPEHLKGITTLAFNYGFRKGELLGLTWNRVNLEEGYLRLEPSDTKPEEPRTVYLDDECLGILARQKQIAKEMGIIDPHVFLNSKAKGPLKDFRWAWDKACVAVGLSGLLFHDLRRSGVKGMVEAGIAEKVGMMISGHKTRSVFDRYHIVSPDALKDAAKKIAKRHEVHGGKRKVVKGDFARGSKLK